LFGTPPTAAVPQPFRFTGTYLDTTGLYTMGARSYDPHLGRFTQSDPAGKETNPYLYATGDPVNHTDPSGLSSWLDWLGGAGDVIDMGATVLEGDTAGAWANLVGFGVDALATAACGTLVSGTGVGATVAPAVCAGVGFYTGAITAELLKN